MNELFAFSIDFSFNKWYALSVKQALCSKAVTVISSTIVKKRSSRLVDPLNGNLFKSILSFTIPVMLTGLLQLAFNAADMIIVGQYAGSSAVGQVGATGSLIQLLVNLFIGFSVGVSVGVSKEYGAKNDTNISKYIHTAVAVAIVAGVLCAVIGFFASKHLLLLMGTPESHIGGSPQFSPRAPG